MINLPKIRNYIVIKDRTELGRAKSVQLCRFVILEQNNMIYIWKREKGKWFSEKYVIFDEGVEKDETVTGLKAYQSFYYYCGKSEVDRMKSVFTPISIWESTEQMHYANFEFANEKIYKPIYEFDANSAFTYGALQLPTEFNKLKEYMQLLYEKKRISTNKITRSKFKNMQNYLVGYFARVRELVAVRSEIIRGSNINISSKMAEIVSKGGNVYLSNTDSIITDEIGANVMNKYMGDEAGKFKLEKVSDRLYYRSSNVYQLGDKIIYSGVSYFARKNTDFFEDRFAEQKGHLIEQFDFSIDDYDGNMVKLCQVRFGTITVNIFNSIGELLEVKKYKIQ